MRMRCYISKDSFMEKCTQIFIFDNMNNKRDRLASKLYVNIDSCIKLFMLKCYTQVYYKRSGHSSWQNQICALKAFYIHIKLFL